MENSHRKKLQTLANAEEQHLAEMSSTTTSTKTTIKQLTSSKAALKTSTVKLGETPVVEQQQQPKPKLNKKKINAATICTKVTQEVESSASTLVTDHAAVESSKTTTTAITANNERKLDETHSPKKKSKSKKSKKQDSGNISVKSSFSKFDALQRSNLIHNPQGEKEINCRLCAKPVYKMEEIKAEKGIYHKNCFRCRECNKQLKVDNYQSHEGVLYCMVHFKLLFAPKCVEDAEPQKPLKPELIIRENQPVELSPDIVRASDKPNLGLEELQQLNVRSRFQVFENGRSKQQPEREPAEPATTIKRSTSILTKLAKLQALGIASGVNIEQAAAQLDVQADADTDGSACGSTDAEDDDADAEEGDRELVRSKKRTQRERPIGLGHAMHDIKTRFENGHALSKEERREERKQEIQNIRSRLFMGKQARIKELYQQAVAESEQAIISADKKPDLEIGTAARGIKERFEKGEMFRNARRHSSDEEHEEGTTRGANNDEAAVFDSAISKKSRSIFMELDANVAADNKQRGAQPPPPLKQKSNAHIYNNDAEQENQSSIGAQQHVVKCDEQPEDVQIATSEISEKFKFFETYRPTEARKKTFRMTPPREGVVRMPTPPETDVENNNNKNSYTDTNDDTHLIEKSQTTSRMLSKFREIEQSKSQPSGYGPRPLKCFTPPPDGGRRYYQEQDDDSDVGSEEGEEEDDEENDDDDYEEQDSESDACYRNNSRLENDEALKEAQAAARAKQLRAKFERWEANEQQRALNDGPIDIYSTQVSDDTNIESTKTIRARFENMKNSEVRSPAAARYQVNRFV